MMDGKRFLHGSVAAFMMLIGIILLIGPYGCNDAGEVAGGPDSAGPALTRNDLPLEPIETTLDQIDSDLERGIISDLEAVTLRGYFFLAPEYLPARYQFEKIKIIKSATLMIRDLYLNWDKFDAFTQDLFGRALTRPDLPYYIDSPAGYFRIHYATSGTDAVYQPSTDANGNGVPDYVDATAAACDFVWINETTTSGIGLAYDHPAYDGGDGGGNNLYDIYLKHYSGAYGVTFQDGNASDQYPGRNAKRSYIFIDPTYQNFGYPNDRLSPMRVTAAHEFFHAVQFIYNSSSSSWFWESSSTWMEDVMYDDINDYYNYLSDRFAKPYLPLKDESNVMAYSDCVWNHFLEESHGGPAFIKDIWIDIISTANSYTAISNVLQRAYGYDIRTDFATWTRWNYICGKNDDGHHYEEGAAWKTRIVGQEVKITYEHSSFPVAGDQPSTKAPEPLGANYIRFIVDQSQSGLRILFDGTDSVQWSAGLVIARTDGSYVEAQIGLDGGYRGSYDVTPLSNVNAIILIPQNLQFGGTGGAAYHYEASYMSGMAAPTGLEAHSTIFSSIAGAKKYVYLNWNPNGEAILDGYNVYRSTSSGSGFSQVSPTAIHDTFFLDKNLDPVMTYYYVVKAVDVNGQESPASNEVNS